MGPFDTSEAGIGKPRGVMSASRSGQVLSTAHRSNVHVAKEAQDPRDEL